MPNINEDLSFFIYGDNINTDAFDNAQSSISESGKEGIDAGDGTANMGDTGFSYGNSDNVSNGTSVGTSAGIGM